MTDQEIEEDKMDRRRWQFDRRVTLGELFTLFSIVAMIYFKGNAVLDEFRLAYTQMDKRVAILEEKANMQKQVDATQDATTLAGQQRIEMSLAEIQRYLRDQRAKQ